MNPLRLQMKIEQWPLKSPFRITGYTFNDVDVLVVTLEANGRLGRGEAHGVYYRNEGPESMMEQIESLRATIEAGISHDSLHKMLPPGGARNALDCALWDLEAKSAGKTIWHLTGIEPRPIATVYTIGLEDTPQLMAARALDAQMYSTLKIKLDGDRPFERITAIRRARPSVGLIVDANQGWTFEQLAELAPKLAQMGVKLIEQPLPFDQDQILESYRCPVALSADESCHHRGDLDRVASRYRFINIKLDKAGGLTEALLLARAARVRGLGLYVGCMCGTSLSMAPAFVLAQCCQYVELDAPLLLRHDRPFKLRCCDGEISRLDARLWG
jgi:L-Ala-D/L-Glu epimerase